MEFIILGIVGLIILYFIIKIAVRNGTIQAMKCMKIEKDEKGISYFLEIDDDDDEEETT